MKYYINSLSTSQKDLDYKALIADANMRRRMSRVVKMGVGAAMDCLSRADGVRIDAIVTAMGLGCLADSEKFLKNIIDNDEQMLNPTPFIQSTFNTIGGQIALLTGNHCYNMTYSHRWTSFENALLDGLLLIDEGKAQNVLVGAADELTPTQTVIMERLGAYRNGNKPAEGAYFFVIGTAAGEGCKASIESLSFGNDEVPNCSKTIEVNRDYFTVSAQALFEGVAAIEDGAESILIKNENFKIVLRCC